MASISISAARDDLSAVVERARTEAVVLERYGKPAAVLLSPSRYAELLDAFVQAEDVAAFDEAMAEDGPNIPWDQVKADLGSSTSSMTVSCWCRRDAGPPPGRRRALSV